MSVDPSNNLACPISQGPFQIRTQGHRPETEGRVTTERARTPGGGQYNPVPVITRGGQEPDDQIPGKKGCVTGDSHDSFVAVAGCPLHAGKDPCQGTRSAGHAVGDDSVIPQMPAPGGIGVDENVPDLGGQAGMDMVKHRPASKVEGCLVSAPHPPCGSTGQDDTKDPGHKDSAPHGHPTALPDSGSMGIPTSLALVPWILVVDPFGIRIPHQTVLAGKAEISAAPQASDQGQVGLAGQLDSPGGKSGA